MISVTVKEKTQMNVWNDVICIFMFALWSSVLFILIFYSLLWNMLYLWSVFCMGQWIVFTLLFECPAVLVNGTGGQELNQWMWPITFGHPSFVFLTQRFTTFLPKAILEEKMGINLKLAERDFRKWTRGSDG